MTTDTQREEQIALSIDHALTAALQSWSRRYGHLATGVYLNIAVGAVLGFAAKESAGVRPGAPLREQFIDEVTRTFETILREACQVLDAKGDSHGN